MYSYKAEKAPLQLVCVLPYVGRMSYSGHSEYFTNRICPFDSILNYLYQWVLSNGD